MILQNRCKINNKNSEIPIFYIIYYYKKNGVQHRHTILFIFLTF